MKLNKILLIFPGEMFLPVSTRKWPLNESLLSLFSYPKTHCIGDVLCLDFTLEPIEFPSSAAELPRFEADIEGILATQQFDVAAISCFSTYSFQSSMLTARLCRKINPEATVVVGGWHGLSHAADFVVPECLFDFVVAGYGEKLLLDIVRGDVVKHPGETRILRANTLIPGEYPWLSYDFSGFERGSRARYGDAIASIESLTISISRGCPYECEFCGNTLLAEKKWEIANVEETVGVLERAAACFPKLRTIFFSEALFGLSKRWRQEFLNRLGTRLPGMNFMAITRVDIHDEEDAEMFKRNRLFLSLGMETMSERMAGIMNKTRNPAHYVERTRILLDLLRKHAVPHEVFIILDHPGETEETMDETLENAHRSFHDRMSVSAFRYIHLPQFALQYGAYRLNHRTEFRGPIEWWKESRFINLRALHESYVPSKRQGESFDAAHARFASKIASLEAFYGQFERRRPLEETIEEFAVRAI
jgi:radical SAM superfamily enzyme YgiQ (UPF0313 family)